MNRTLRIGLKILGAGFLSGFASLASGRWGPCGPSNIVGLIFMLMALPLLPVGALVSLAGIVVAIGKWDRARAHGARAPQP